MRLKKRLGEMLVEAGIISDYQLSVAVGRQQKLNLSIKLGEQLVQLGYTTEEAIAQTLEQQLGMKWINLKDIDIPQDVLDLLKIETITKYKVLPIAADKRTVSIATSEPTDMKTIDTLGFMLHRRVDPIIATPSDILWGINKYYLGIEENEITLDIDKSAAPVHKEEFAYKQRREAYLDGLAEALFEVLAEKGIVDKDDIMRRIEKRLK